MRPMTSENGRKKTRRPNGTGSEWKDAKGVWHARKQTDPDPRTGRRRWIEAQAPTKTAARQKLEAKIDQRRRQGTLPLTDVPAVDLYLDRWLHQAANRVKPRVLDTYRSECNAIRGVIGGMRLDRITPETIEAMCDELATTRSGKTVHNIYIRTKQILTHAVRDKLIPINPALAAIPPRYEPADTIILQPGQPAAAIHAAHDPKPRKRDTLHDDQSDHDMWALMFDLAFATGMRQAERFAITPSELVTRDGIHGIEVRWQLQQLKPDATIPGWLQARHITGNFWLIPPKTRQGIRFIPPSTPEHGSDSSNSPTNTNAHPTTSSSPATANHSPATSNDAAGNERSRTPDSHPSPCEPHATSSAPTSPKPAHPKTPAKPSWATPKSPPPPDTPTGHQKPSPRSPTRPGLSLEVCNWGSVSESV